MQRIVFDNDSKKSYEIADSEGNVRGVIEVDTTDFDIFTRAEQAAEKIREIINSAGNGENGSEKDILFEVSRIDKLVKEQIDYIFDGKVSDIVFGSKRCLNLRNGRTLAEIFIESIMKEISRDFGRLNKGTSQNVRKYVDPYRRQSHGKKRKK